MYGNRDRSRHSFQHDDRDVYEDRHRDTYDHFRKRTHHHSSYNSSTSAYRDYNDHDRSRRHHGGDWRGHESSGETSRREEYGRHDRDGRRGHYSHNERGGWQENRSEQAQRTSSSSLHGWERSGDVEPERMRAWGMKSSRTDEDASSGKPSESERTRFDSRDEMPPSRAEREGPKGGFERQKGFYDRSDNGWDSSRRRHLGNSSQSAHDPEASSSSTPTLHRAASSQQRDTTREDPSRRDVSEADRSWEPAAAWKAGNREEGTEQPQSLSKNAKKNRKKKQKAQQQAAQKVNVREGGGMNKYVLQVSSPKHSFAHRATIFFQLDEKGIHSQQSIPKQRCARQTIWFFPGPPVSVSTGVSSQAKLTSTLEVTLHCSFEESCHQEESERVRQITSLFSASYPSARESQGPQATL